MTAESIEGFFAPGGGLERAHPDYETRPGQLAMALAVEETFRDGGRLLVEAGTGTGKTLAYLIPALRSGRRVVVSTGTRNLQDQIFQQDLPFLRNKVGLRFDAVLMKGRDNYLCRQKWAEFEKQPLLEVREEARWIRPIAAWSRQTRSGDRAEVGALPDDLRLWRDVNARADTCTGRKCAEFETCWLTRLKRAAENAQVLVVNHHLFFADLAVRSAYGAVLPEYDTVVFDEAHLLEDTATAFFGTTVSTAQVDELARDAEKLAGGKASASDLREASRAFFDEVRRHFPDGAGRRPFASQERGGPDLDEAWAALSGAIDETVRAAGTAGEGIEGRAAELKEAFVAVLDRRQPGFVYGVERRGRLGVILSASPIDVAQTLREKLFDTLHASVLCSATLAVSGKFDFFRRRLGLEDARGEIVESPFDPATQARLYLPKSMPEPRDPSFVPRAIGEIRRLLEISKGRAFLLFTSYANLHKVKDALEREGRWALFVQGEGSKAALVERFRETPEAVLLGTSSFWHGVDVPGEALSLVVIDKLPFDVPNDPLVAARIDRIREDGGSPFDEYQLPLAVLELKQGVGRLLRRKTDRGIVAVLDPRLTTKGYGKTFLKSLPAYPVVRDQEACVAFFEASPRS